ncbi:MAG: septum formation initiator family protein [Acidobacteriota bacterium]
MNRVVNSSSVNDFKPTIYELAYWQQLASMLHLPAYVWVSMILLAATGLCYSLTVHTHAELGAATSEHQQLAREVKRLEMENVRLTQQLEAVEKDPRTIETLARRAGMVAADEAVILIESHPTAPTTKPQANTCPER